MNLKAKKLNPCAKIPKRAHSGDLGFDLFIPTNNSVTIEPGDTKLVDTGISIQFPTGWGAFLKARSSQGIIGLDIYGGVIDNAYRGSIGVTIHNSDVEPIHYVGGEKIGQLVPIPVFIYDIDEIEEFTNETVRGTAGFGSTGR